MRLLIALILVVAAPAAASQTIELQYDNGVPYDVLNDNDIEGEAMRFTCPAPCRILSVRFYPDDDGDVEIHIWKDDGGHKPDRLSGGDLLTPPIVVDATGGQWNEIVLPTPIVIDPPRPFYVGQFDMSNNTPHIYLDDGWPLRSDSRNNLYGEGMDSGHSNEKRWRILGEVDLDGTPRRHYFMIRATIETFNEVAEHRFEDVAAEVGFPHAAHLAWGDYDNDGYEDLLLFGRTMLRNSGPPDWTFTNVTGAIGIGGSYIGGLFADYDNDGDLDFYAIGWQSNGEAMWRNDGPPNYGFTNVTAAVGNPTDSDPTEAAGWGDYDLDGYVDLYVAGAETYPTQYQDHLYRNTGPPGFVFQEVSVASGIRNVPDQVGRSVAWCDYNEDDWPDIYVGNYRLDRNFLFENQGDDTFDNVASDEGVEGQSPSSSSYGHTIGAVWGDVDNDGDQDLLVSNLAHSNWLDWSDTTKLYRNSGPPNYDFTDLLGLTETNRLSSAGVYYNETHSDPSLIDYDGDGFLDIFISCVYVGWESELYRNAGDPVNPHFILDNYPSGLVVDNGWGSGWSDYDHDGDLDLAAGTSATTVGGFFRNNSNSSTRNDIPNWLSVRLEGVQANAAAIGAVITLHYPGGIQTRQVVSGRGAASGDSFVQYFGLGPHTTVDRLEIRWPGGCPLQTYYPWSTNQTVTIVEDCDPVERCDQGQDEDGDGDIDCADSDCIGHPGCPEGGNCSDGVDNDGDGDTDCADTDCIGDPACPEALFCGDGIDNDGDGDTDCADTDCIGDAACPEALFCGDGIDNDGDGDTDCADTDCIGDAACPEALFCSDGIDNDGDGDTDCADTDCAGTDLCPGIAVNRSVVVGPDGPSPPLSTIFDPGCHVGSWRLCPEEHNTEYGSELRMVGEAAPVLPGRLSVYEHSKDVMVIVAVDGDDLVLSWPDPPTCPAESECSEGPGCTASLNCFYLDTGDQECLEPDESLFRCRGGETVHIRRCTCFGLSCPLNDNHLECRLPGD